jgi:hypothetical protein
LDESTFINSECLTIVIPTRDRPDLLEVCLQSVFECQTTVPKVIISDNSTLNYPVIEILRRRYGFTYVRQSGEMSMTDHLNTCLHLPSTPWMMLLHDDDELYPDSLAKIEPLLRGCENVALVVGGLQYIDPHGNLFGEWVPEVKETLRAEDALLRLVFPHLQARSPNTILSVAKSCDLGGFPEVNGFAADYTFFCRLVYFYGLALVPECVGRYRSGHEQATDFSTPEKAEMHLQYCVQMAKLVQSTGCSSIVVDQIVDHMTWGLFLIYAPLWWDSHPAFVSGLLQQCLLLSPHPGAMQLRARREYSFLF